MTRQYHDTWPATPDAPDPFRVLPVDVQMRADAELGAAFRRAEAALPKGWSLTVAIVGRTHLARVWERWDGDGFGRSAMSTVAVLDALREALEARTE